jgi:uncharacterized protein YecE (DUF72 family)
VTEQPDLFDPAPPPLPAPRPDLVELARQVPPDVKFGTSTWTYDGWRGDVYHRSYRGLQPARRLEEYARYPLFGTVGIDSAFYDPPTDEELAEYARHLPPGFPCVSKVWDRITARRLGDDRRWGDLAGRRNPDFLNAQLFKDAVLLPYARAFRDHAGCFVFEFQAMRGKDLPDPLQWVEELDRFFAELPGEFRYAVELRNPELFHPLHGEVLKRHGVAHVFNSWTEMPSIGKQLEEPWVFPASFTVARALLRPGRSYAEAVKLFEPYERVQEPNPTLRRDLIRLMEEAVRRRIEALIVVNNRAEGNAPGTIKAVLDEWRRSRAGSAAGASRSGPASRG